MISRNQLYKQDLVNDERDLGEWLESLAVNAKVATVLGSISASSDTVKSEGRHMTQYWITYIPIIIQYPNVLVVPVASFYELGTYTCGRFTYLRSADSLTFAIH